MIENANNHAHCPASGRPGCSSPDGASPRGKLPSGLPRGPPRGTAGLNPNPVQLDQVATRLGCPLECKPPKDFGPGGEAGVDSSYTGRHGRCVRDLKQKQRSNARAIGKMATRSPACNEKGNKGIDGECLGCASALSGWGVSQFGPRPMCHVPEHRSIDFSTLTLAFNEKENTKGSYGKYTLLSDEGCQSSARLMWQARSAVRFLMLERGLIPMRPLPPRIECGHLRSAIRGVFSESIPLEDELSIKTSAKLETDCCEFCEPRFAEHISAWKEARLRPVEPACEEHLAMFKRALKANVPRGWDGQRSPYIPNGHASKSYRRRDGGNWNDESFSEDARVSLVFSSGKPRVVTLYSSFNTAVLTPIHHSLYAHLSRKGWLLKGPPTAARISRLEEAGEYVSVDYSSATDNIRLDYVRAAIEVLKEQAWGLSEDESACLDVLGRLRIDGRECFTGQPMGSVFSFPLLCLINKTLVDLSLTDLLLTKKISFKEWTSHRLIVNGDDLLLREPRKGKTLLMSRLSANATKVGMVVNKEKSMIDCRRAEINSTLFDEGQEKKKTNCGALKMKSTVDDVLGFAYEATVTVEGFKSLVRRHANVLARQADKKLNCVPYVCQAACLKDKKIKRALLSGPSTGRPQPPNLMPIVERPEGYDLSREQEVEAIVSRVRAVKERKEWKESIEATRRLRKHRTGIVRGKYTLRDIRKQKPTAEKEVVLLCCAAAWKKERMAALITEESSALDVLYPETTLVYDGSRINALVDLIRYHKTTLRIPTAATPTDRSSMICLTQGDGFEGGDDWIPLW